MSTMTIKAATRQLAGAGALRNLRRAGRIPGIVYGKSELSPIPVSVESKELQSVLRSHSHAVVNLEISGYGKRNVLLSEVQRDPLSGEVRHVDFHRISMKEAIRTLVPLEVSGPAAGEKEGGMLQTVVYELEIECMPAQLPDSIVVDVTGMQIGDTLVVADVKLPDGVKTTADEDTVIAAVLAPQKETSEAEAEAEAPDDGVGDKEQRAESVQ